MSILRKSGKLIEYRLYVCSSGSWRETKGRAISHSCSEQALIVAVIRNEMEHGRPCTRGFAPYRNFTGVATEEVDVSLHPSQGGSL